MKLMELDQVDSTSYHEYDVDGESFTGELVETGRDGELLEVETVVDGLPHGPSRSWYPGGALKFEVMVVRSCAVGISREWHPNGVLAREILFDPGGNLIARRPWDNVGNALTNELYTMPAGHVRGQQLPEMRRVELDTLDDENSLEYVLDGVPFSGQVVETGNSGQLLSLVTVERGVPEGTMVVCYPNGMMKYQEAVSNGQVVGAVRKWYSNGQLAEEKSYDRRGTLIGASRWNEEGRRIDG